MPSLGFAHYEERLSNAGFNYVHQIADTPDVQQTFDQLEIPVGIRREIFECAVRMTRNVRKPKTEIKGDAHTAI